MGKKKKQVGEKSSDKDKQGFILRSQELKQEGDRMFQRGKYEVALKRYEEAIKFLPENHIEVSCLRSKKAACYMQDERYAGYRGAIWAIYECNLALKVHPKYSKALLNRASCYEAINSLDGAVRDVCTVLKMEPDNKMAFEIFEKVNYKLDEKQGLNVAADFAISELPSDHAGPSCVPPEEKNEMKSKKVQLLTADNVGLHQKLTEEKLKAKKLKENKEKLEDSIGKKKVVANKSEEKVAKEMISEAYTKEVIEGKFRDTKEEATKKRVKLVYGEDIRFATLEVNCSLQHLREVISNQFPRLGAVLVKYKDEEGDLVTITSDEELRWAETSTGSESYMRLHIVDTDPKQDPLFDCYPSFSF